MVIDALRGYFIVWIGLYNTFAVFNAIQPNLILSSILLFINDKGWFCLSTIFGYGFGMLLKRDDVANLAFPKRMLLLFILGLFNNLFFYGDILKEYAIIGLILFYGRPILAKYPFQSVLFIFIFTLTSLYFISFDMQRAGYLRTIFQENNSIIANLTYCYYLNIHSLYYAVCFHAEILLMASLGFIIAFFSLERLLVLHQSKLFWGSFFMMLTVLFLALFTIEKGNSFFKLLFFAYVFSLSTWFVMGFYKLFKKYKFIGTLFIPFGRRSLTIYLLQNFLICSIWIWSQPFVLTHYAVFFLAYCIIQLLLLFSSRFFVVNNIGIIELYWKKLSAN